MEVLWLGIPSMYGLPCISTAFICQLLGAKLWSKHHLSLLVLFFVPLISCLDATKACFGVSSSWKVQCACLEQHPTLDLLQNCDCCFEVGVYCRTTRYHLFMFWLTFRSKLSLWDTMHYLSLQEHLLWRRGSLWCCFGKPDNHIVHQLLLSLRMLLNAGSECMSLQNHKRNGLSFLS